MTTPNAVLLAGSGLLSSVACTLVEGGWRVVSPSHRYLPLPADERRDSLPERGRAVWVEARWDRSRELARDVEKALTAPARLLVAWVHDSYRRTVLSAVEPLLAPGAPVVEVCRLGLTDVEPRPLLAGHPTQQVLLGDVSERHRARPLGQAEVVAGVLLAVERALDGRPLSVHQLGERRSAH